jgi:signal transduction histidine kinase/CheY-like chemotaxis protein
MPERQPQGGPGVFTWSRKEKGGTIGGQNSQAHSLLRMGRASASTRADWIFQAIQELSERGGVDRVGVWLDEAQSAPESHSGGAFRGEVWEREVGNGPAGWVRLSEDAIPKELLEGKSCEHSLDGRHAGLILGPLVELARALWVPVSANGMLRGVLMLGTRNKQVVLPRKAAEKTAEELGLLLELEEGRRVAAARKADLELERRVQGLMRDGQGEGIILSQLTESCTRAGALGGVGAYFALIAQRTGHPGQKRIPGLEAPGTVTGNGEEHLASRAQSGERNWEMSLKEVSLESFCIHAIEQQHTIGADAERLPRGKEALRILAIPLGRGKEIYGVMLAGLARSKASLEALERLEVRAALATEVLDRERREHIAVEQEQWYQALLKSSEQPVVLIGKHGRIRSMSQGARELLDDEHAHGESAAGGLQLAEFFRPKHAERVEHWLEENGNAKRASDETTLDAELRNGQSVRLSRLATPGEKFLAVKLTRGKGEKAPRKTEEVEEELRQAMDWLEEGVVVFDEAGEVVARNRRFLQIMGLNEKQGRKLRSLDDLIRETAGNFASPELFASDWRALGQNGAEGSQEELPMEKPVPQVVERSTRPIFGASGKKLGRVEVYREVTARRMFQSRMLQAEKLATLGQRATAIMHELSNPLTTILGNAQRMILRAESGPPSAEAHRILQEAERATSILRQLLLLSREARPERKLISLNDLAQHAVDLYRASLSGSIVQVQVETAAALPRISADAGQLQQVLLNLLQNAQQAIEQSGRGTTIGVRTAEVAEDRVRLEVWDDGPGIPDAIQARIFDPFFTTKPEGMGTGLGLAIVNGFVRQHGGSISLYCPPEGGSRFMVELPATAEGQRAAAQTAAEISSKAKSVPAPAGTLATGPTVARVPAEKSPRVLVVEDETIVANLIADVLRDDGMQVEVLQDAQRALDAARSVDYDLAICDLKMPGMDGQGFYGELQEEQNSLRERILFVTGDVVSARAQEFLERNQLPHLAKPFRVEELSEAVRQVLWGKTRAAAASTRERV